MKKLLPIGFMALWLVVLFLLGGYYLFSAPRDSAYSPEENRTLAGFPELTAESLFSGQFGQDVETYLLDRFPGRNTVISVTNVLQDLLSFASHDEYLLIAEGPQDMLDSETDEEDLEDLLSDLTEPAETQSPENDVPETGETTAPEAGEDTIKLEDFPGQLHVYMDRGKGTAKLETYSRNRVAAVTAVLNKYARLLPEDGTLTFTVVPQSTLGNRYVNAKEHAGFYADWDDVVNGLSDQNVWAFDAAEILGQAIAAGEYVYFRTDMHWTPYGSYLVYRQMVEKAGKTPCSYTEDFDLTVEEPFRGTYYRDNPTAYNSVKPDTLDLLMPKVPLEWRRTTAPDEYKRIDFLNFNAKRNDRYTVYLGGPAGPWTYAQCDNGEADACLVVTDSFGLSYIPFLTANYAQVHYYDPRHFDKRDVGYTVAEMIEKYNIKDIYVVVGDLHSFGSAFLTRTANQQLGVE